jgi:uncharacterized protein
MRLARRAAEFSALMSRLSGYEQRALAQQECRASPTPKRRSSMRRGFPLATTIVAALLLCLVLYLAVPVLVAEPGKPHRVSIQVDQNDPDIMNMALNNAAHVIEYYREQGEDAQVEIVAYGPGLHMLRADTSPVQERIRQLAQDHTPIAYSACGNTKAGMEKREGHPVPILPQASVVPSGVVRLMQLQETGWSYVRP